MEWRVANGEWRTTSGERRMASGEPLLLSVRRSPFATFLATLFVAMIASCTSVTETTFSPQIVVQGYLYANEPLDSIVVRQTIPIVGVSGNDRVSGAIVSITKGDSTYLLREDTSLRGRYIGTSPIMIESGATYTLRVQALGQVVTASTTVPLAIHLDSVKLNAQMLSLTGTDTITYPTTVANLESPGIHLWWSPSLGTAGYGLEALSLDTAADTILDVVSSALDDSAATGQYQFFILSTDEQVVWPQFTRYGLNAVRAMALDKNYEDFVLGLYLSSSQFDNSTLDVTGGLGIFGSAARAGKNVFLK